MPRDSSQGKTLDDALAVCRRTHSEGISATLDYLGENVRSLDEAAACRDLCIHAVLELSKAGAKPNVSVKLTQFGMDLSPEARIANVTELGRIAESVGGFVRVDMEGSPHNDRTLDFMQRNRDSAIIRPLPHTTNASSIASSDS